ncbi:MAG TPA: hypothetical protein VEP89_17035 [Draconibacterium sp.]|nr:hypothetical protein [Draconibacterium sp.]
MAYSLPDLGYDYDALQSRIDGRTMEIRYIKHRAFSLKKFNAVIQDTTLEDNIPKAIFAENSKHNEEVRK